jgi:tetratricopeptide (TPR) repeat protein
MELYGSTNPYLVAFCKENRAHILARLGRYGEARQLLDELFNSKEAFDGLMPDLHLNRAEMSLSQGDLAQAVSSSNEAIKAGGPKSNTTVQAQYVLALAKAVNGGQAEARKLCERSMEATSTAGDYGLHSRTLLACAEVALKAKDAKSALALASQAQERFARGGQLESEWRAWDIASYASRDLGDNNKAQEQKSNAEGARSKLEQQWGSEAFKLYAARPDIQVFYQ